MDTSPLPANTTFKSIWCSISIYLYGYNCKVGLAETMMDI